MFGKLPDLSNLRVFGCQVFFHIDKSKRRKLGRKSSDEGIFVGYASNGHAWLAYNPITRGITIEQTVLYSKSSGSM